MDFSSIFGRFHGKFSDKSVPCLLKKLEADFKKNQDGLVRFDMDYSIVRVGFKKDQSTSWNELANLKLQLSTMLEQNKLVKAVTERRLNNNGNAYAFHEVYALVSCKDSERVVQDLRSRIDPSFHVDTLDRGFNFLSKEQRDDRVAIILELMLNAVFHAERHESEEFKDIFSCGGSNVLIYTQKYNGDEICTLNFKIDNESNLDVRVVTYSRRCVVKDNLRRLRLKQKMFATMPKYRVSGVTLSYINEDVGDDDTTVYVQRSLHPDRRNRYGDFNRTKPKDTDDSVDWDEEVNSSKSYYLMEVVKLMSSMFADYVSLRFKSVNLDVNLTPYGYKKRTDSVKDLLVNRIGKKVHLSIISRLKECDFDNILVAKLKELYTNFFKDTGTDMEITVDSDPKPDSLNTVLTHDKEYYKKNSSEIDVYVNDVSGDIALQHVTSEYLKSTLSKARKADSFKKTKSIEVPMEERCLPSYLAYVLLNELIIKRDIKEKVFGFPFYPKEIEDKVISFVVRKRVKSASKEEKDKSFEMFFICDIYYGKKISFQMGKMNELYGFDSPNIQRILDGILELCKPYRGDAYLVTDGKDLAVVETAKFTVLPDYGQIQKTIEDRLGLRSTEAREKCFAGYYGFSSFEMDGIRYFMAGLMPDALAGTENLATSVRPRRIVPVCGDCKVIVTAVLGTMDTIYLYRDRMNVNPVPIKYLNEFIKNWFVQHRNEYIDADKRDSDDEGDETDDCETYPDTLFDFSLDLISSQKALDKKANRKYNVISFAVSSKFKECIDKIISSACLKNYTNFELLIHNLFLSYLCNVLDLDPSCIPEPLTMDNETTMRFTILEKKLKQMFKPVS